MAEETTQPLDQAVYDNMSQAAASKGDLKVSELIAGGGEFLGGMNPEDINKYLVEQGIDLDTATVAETRDLLVNKVAGKSAPNIETAKTQEEIQRQEMNAAQGNVTKTVDAQQIDTKDPNLKAKAETGKATQIGKVKKREVTAGEFVTGQKLTPEELESLNMEAATAEPSDLATTRGQLVLMEKDWAGGRIPPYAAGALRGVNAAMQARGISASSIAGQAMMQAGLESSVQIAMADAKAHQTFELTNLSNRQQSAVLNAQMRASIMGKVLDNRQQAAVINASRITEANNMTYTAEQTVVLENARMMQQMNLTNLNNKQQVALQNAATYANMQKANLDARMQAQVTNAQNFLQMDLANLNNEQQSRTLEYQSVIQGIFTDQAAENATRQFNAKSQMQVDQFYTEMNAQIEQANATRMSNLRQFNVNQENAMKQYNQSMKFNRERYNSNMQMQIDQSNVEWRRQINTANTAEQNNANRLQYQTLMSMTAQSQNNVWNFYRDCAAWMMSTAENREGRAHDSAMLSQQIAGNTDLYQQKFLNNLMLDLGMTWGMS